MFYMVLAFGRIILVSISPRLQDVLKLALKPKSMTHYINFHTQCQANKNMNIQTSKYVS